ncbi:DUF2141 domain-containing protein [Henriciella sp. AS95]|uniref:DUF2141 domain-containing protein n=1 Tax=Henriciella sp. AS95 TaxID=3135782 RepID=UPI003174B106
MTKTSILIAASICAAALGPVALAAPLTVTLTDIESQTGVISIGVFDEEGYKSGKAVTGANVAADGASVSVTIEGLEPGEYGLKLYHDVNDDGEMNTNPFGMPIEPFAFSNNAKGQFGPAKWDAARFEVSEEGAEQTIVIN